MSELGPAHRALLRSPKARRLAAHDRPGPRYTSYPTVPRWGALARDRWLRSMEALTGDVAVYVHVPFCREQCLYCGCNMVVARRQAAGDRYLDALAAQLASFPSPRVRIARIHLGGGTPTWLTPDQLARLWSLLQDWRPLAKQGAWSVEADPDATTDAHLDRLAALGVRRISYGVQSLDPAVCEGVGRPQRPGQVAARVAAARARGFAVNLDLMYGLPGQTPETWERTLDGVVEMAPDRIAVFGYAHVPWLKPHQAALEPGGLPGPDLRLWMMLHAHARFRTAGWVQIGFDHFAKAGDPLAVASSSGTLHRDFMGFTDRQGLPLVGLGPSAISELPGVYMQQEAKLGPWLRAARGGSVPIARGHMLSADDALRRDVILGLTCRHRVTWRSLRRAHGAGVRGRLEGALRSLAALEVEGLVHVDEEGVWIPEDARLLSRRVAMVFDEGLTSLGRHSRVV